MTLIQPWLTLCYNPAMPVLPLDIPVSKRVFDLALTIPGIILISPLVVLIVILIWAFHGWPVIFAQRRPGYRGKPFSVYKFRTMTETHDAQGNLLPDAERLTPLGTFLRSTSLDELPELFNVLRGEMSLVGPRPLLMQYLVRYTPEQAHRHDVLPGITGWAQINGRNALTWEDKFRMDVWYVDHWSFWLDFKILILTFWKVIKREGINQTENITMDEFMGTEERIENGESRVENCNK
jgi:lipopolysaccharide/colanic/teichoic acid biosynthesis glycosyltransferase